MQSQFFGNVVEFGRLLRGAGMPIGPAQLAESLRAIELAGVRNREDFYWALAGTLITRPEQRPIFDQAFQLFWRTPEKLQPVVELTIPRPGDEPDDAHGDFDRHAAFAISGEAPSPDAPESGSDTPEDRRDSASEAEVLSEKHFEQMDADELARAKRKLEQLDFDLEPIRTRRRERNTNGSLIDWRRSFRGMLRGAGAMSEFAYASRREEAPALVVLCDISGSMQLYSRVLLHFICALGARRKHTHAFLFGTRLTDVSRFIAGRDAARAVERICAATRDFDGGTRIGAALAEFNRKWSRRLLARKPVVILVSDGLEGESVDLLAREIDRLHRSCGRLMWLNPLLRYAGFEPKAAGVKTIIRHVDSLHAVHSIRHVADVAAALARPTSRDAGRN